MSKDQPILIIINNTCFSAKLWSDSFPIQKFQSNLICNIRFFLLYLVKNILEISLHIFHFLDCQGVEQSCVLPQKQNQR